MKNILTILILIVLAIPARAAIYSNRFTTNTDANATAQATAAAQAVVSSNNAILPIARWQRLGTCIYNDYNDMWAQEPNITCDFSAPHYVTTNNISPYVFKMWYDRGLTDPWLAYAESLDGLNWVGPTNALVPFARAASLFQWNGTNFFYICTNATGNAGGPFWINLWESKIGVDTNLTLIATNVVPRTQSFENLSVGNSCVWSNPVAGEFEMEFDGTGSGNTFEPCAAFSTDLINWTVLTHLLITNSWNGSFGAGYERTVGTNFYLWCNRQRRRTSRPSSMPPWFNHPTSAVLAARTEPTGRGMERHSQDRPQTRASMTAVDRLPTRL